MKITLENLLVVVRTRFNETFNLSFCFLIAGVRKLSAIFACEYRENKLTLLARNDFSSFFYFTVCLFLYVSFSISLFLSLFLSFFDFFAFEISNIRLNLCFVLRVLWEFVPVWMTSKASSCMNARKAKAIIVQQKQRWLFSPKPVFMSGPGNYLRCVILGINQYLTVNFLFYSKVLATLNQYQFNCC